MGMTHEQGEDLGHGVFVSLGLGAELTVTSRRLDLGWREARGQVPGSDRDWARRSLDIATLG